MWKKRIENWFLNRIKRSLPKSTDGTVYCYSGCISGRDFGETEEKGGYYLEFDPKEPTNPKNIRFVPFSSRRFMITEINIETLRTPSEISLLIESDLLDSNTNLRVILKGERSFEISEITEELHKAIDNILNPKCPWRTLRGENICNDDKTWR